MLHLLRAALVGAVFLPLVFADDMFAGCYLTTPRATAPPASGPATRDSASLCVAACYNDYTHAYYRADTKQCLCSNGTPFQTDLRVGSPDACGANYDNRLTRTSYMALTPRCYATQPAGLRNIAQFTGLNGCLLSCRNELRATFWANTAVSPGNNYFCACNFPTSYGAGATCGPNAFFGFYHTPEAAASGLTRRKQREEIAARNNAEKLWCPRGWTACLVEGADDDTYECIDTNSDLESCGGCLSGQYSSPNSTIGEDCSFMTGAVLGGSTCLNGNCQAYACSRGYMLVDGECVRR